MREEKRLATKENYKEINVTETWDYDDRPKKPEEPKLTLSYEHIAHLHNQEFERKICRDDFVQKYSPYSNILQFLHVFRCQFGLGPYDPLPEERLNIFIADEMPDTLERLYPEENPAPKQRAKAEPDAAEKTQGSLFESAS